MFFYFDNQPYKCRTKDYFWFNEIRQAIEAIVQDGISTDAIAELSASGNFFSAASKARAKETASGVIRRLNVADEAFFSFFMKQFVQDQKILNMILIMLENRSVYEFMNEIFKEKLISGDMHISDAEILGFIHDIQAKDAKAATWGDASVKKFRTCIKWYLNDSGLTVPDGKGVVRIVRPILGQHMEDFLKQEGLTEVYKILAGER